MSFLTDRQASAGYGALIQFPGDTKNAATVLNVDMEANDRAAAAVGGAVRQRWDDFYTAWKIYYEPIAASWDWNPVGAAAFADQADIEDWRKRMNALAADLRSSGASSATQSEERTGNDPFAFVSDFTWPILAGIALILVFRLVPDRRK